MIDYFIRNDNDGKINRIYCDFPEDKSFKNELEFETFLEQNPGCSYINKNINKDGSIEAVFAVYLHDYWTGKSTGQNYSYSVNPVDI